MKNIFLTLAAALVLCAVSAYPRDLVILHTNDTHSHIDAENGVGGVLQRKAMIDSIKKAEKDVLVVDAGDIVQGSLYFKLFGGELEYPLMEMMGYDVQILGNHEFDNGLDELARHLHRGGPAKLVANYDFSQTPLKGVTDPYVIKKIGGKKIGIMGIGLDPAGMVAPENYRGMKFADIVATANDTAGRLRRDGCDIVVAVTHLGYTTDTGTPLVTDVGLARLSKGIDIIIGGHSHEMVSPATAGERPNVVDNAEGRPVLIAQTGRYGANLGYIKVGLDGGAPVVKQAGLLPVAGVDPKRFDKKIERFLSPYRHVVDSINNRVIAECIVDMPNTKNYYTSVLLSNFTADVAEAYASHVLDSLNAPGLPKRVDLAVMNSGGIRMPMKRGPVTEGQILSTYPFSNHLVIKEMTGVQLDSLIRQAAVLANQAFSKSTLVAVSRGTANVEGVLINGYPLDPGRTYYVAMLDYLADGGDYLTTAAAGTVVWRDPAEWCAPVMRYVVDMGKASMPIDPDPRCRLRGADSIPDMR